jgi:hypothetical protein
MVAGISGAGPGPSITEDSLSPDILSQTWLFKSWRVLAIFVMFRTSAQNPSEPYTGQSQSAEVQDASTWGTDVFWAYTEDKMA